MKVLKLALNNYKAFKSFSIDFEKDVNVLYGLNGVGKSTILQSIIMLLQLINTKNGLPSNHVFIHSRDYFDENFDVSISFEVEIDNQRKKFGIVKPSSSYERGLRASAPESNQQVIMVNFFKNGSTLADGTRFTGDLNFFSEPSVLAHHTALIPGTNIPRVSNQQGIPGQFEVQFEFPARFASVRGLTRLKDDIEWFKNKEGLEQQLRLEEDTSYRDSALESLRSALTRFDSSLTDIKINRRILNHPLTVCKNGKNLELDSISDGEGTIIGILLHLSSLQDGLNNNNAVLIIDEIDNSLHPKWQSEIIISLRKAFPNWQIIASSHSPFVWSRLKKQNVKFLDRDKDDRIMTVPIEYAKGSSIESLVAEFFGITTVDEEVQPLLNEIETLLSKREGATARAKIAYIRDTYGNLPILVKYEAKLQGYGI